MAELAEQLDTNQLPTPEGGSGAGGPPAGPSSVDFDTPEPSTTPNPNAKQFWIKPRMGFGNEPAAGGNPYAEPARRETLG